jgi:hypothetical protein
MIWQSSDYGQLLSSLGFEFADGKAMRTLTVDPTAGAGVSADIGTVGLRDNAGAGEMWLKIAASDTSWAMIADKPVVLTTDVTGVLPVANGGTNSSTALNSNRIMISSGGAIVEQSALTAGGVLFADANGLPVEDDTNFFWNNTTKELGAGNDAATTGITVGGTARTSPLNSSGDDGDYAAVLRKHAGAGFDGAVIAMARTRGNSGSLAAVQADDEVGSIKGIGRGGGAYDIAAAIDFEIDAAVGASDMPGRIVFSVSPDGSATPAEAMRISNDKKVTFAGTVDTALSTAGPVITDASGVLSSEATLAIARGGTNSGTALNNNRLMRSSGGAIVELGALNPTSVLFADSNGMPSYNASWFIWDEANGSLGIGSAATAMGFTIDGTTDYVNRLHIGISGTGTEYAAALNKWSDDANGVKLAGIKTRGVYNIRSATQADDTIMDIQAIAQGAGELNLAASIKFSVDAAPNADDMPGRIGFYVTPDGTNAIAEALRIPNDGTLQFMQEESTPASPATNTHKLYVDSTSNYFHHMDSAGTSNQLMETTSITSDTTLTASDTLAITSTRHLQTFLVSGDSAAITLSTTPFGATPPVDGGIIYLIGNSDTNTVTIPQNDAADGCLMDGDVTLAKGQTIGLMYSSSLDRYVRIK